MTPLAIVDKEIADLHDFFTEWQTGATMSDDANNARITTVLMEMTDPLTWLHIQETWLPDAVRDAGMPEYREPHPLSQQFHITRTR